MERSPFLLFLLVLLLLCAIITVFPQTEPKNELSPFSLSIHTGFDLPLGVSDSMFTYGGSGTVSGLYTFEALPFLSVGATLQYGLIQSNAQFLLHNLTGKAVAKVAITPIPWLEIYGFGFGGYAVSLMEIADTMVSQSNPMFGGGAGLAFYLSENIGLGPKISYKHYPGLYGGMDFTIGTSIRFNKPKELDPNLFRPDLLIAAEDYLSVDEVNFEQVFPVFHKYYDDHPVGTVTITNIHEEDTIEDVRVNFFVNNYMDTEKLCSDALTLQPGESRQVELFALFNDNILEITEATKVAAEIIIGLKAEEARTDYKNVETLRIYDRNAITWDDDRKAAAFVSAKDPLVLSIGKSVAGTVKEHGSSAIDQNLLIAMGIHSLLPLLGINYVIDPQTPYEEFSKNKNIVDFLQFPRQTLEYKAGDCDDLSVLYCALLESVGAQTAFITIPGHIFMAFALKMDPVQARRDFSSSEDFIFTEDAAWVPVEVTSIKGGFLKAWQEGAKEWRENNTHNTARMYPVHEAWKIYEPVGIFEKTEKLAMPEESEFQASFQKEYTRLIEREIYPMIVKLNELVEQRGETPRLMNKYGIIYAKYGLYDKAEEYFEKAVSPSDYLPALINIGNMYFLNNEMEKALSYYNRAYALEPEHPKVLLCVARANHEMENYRLMNTQYQKLKEINPALAERFAYLEFKGEEATARAAELGGRRGTVLWEEEE